MTVRPPARPVRTTLAGELRRRGAWHDKPDRLRRKQQSPPEPGRYSRPAGPHLDSAARVSGQQAGRSGCGRLGPNRRAGRLARCIWLSGKASESWLRISNYASELGGSMGIRTPDLLHAIQWHHVHRSTSVQVTVSGRPHPSPGIQACCCTFVLTVPSFHRRKLSGPAPGRRTLDIAPDCICQPPEIAVANDLTLLRRTRDTGPWRSARQVAGSRLILRM